MIYKHYQDGPNLDVAGLNRITVLIDRSETELSEVALNAWGPTLDGPPHSHAQKEQIFYITGGRGLIKIGTETFSAERGGFFFVPAGLEHQSINQGTDALEYFLFNAFLNSDKEGHASFAEHIEKVKETRRQQASAQRSDAGPGAESTNATRKGKFVPPPAGPDVGGTTTLLDRKDADRCEAIRIILPPGTSLPSHADDTKEQTLFVVAGTGTLRIGAETRPASAGFVAFVPRHTPLTLEATSDTLQVISFGTVC